MMSKVYRHGFLGADEYLGKVDPDGKVYDGHFDPERFVGQANLETGQVYDSRLGNVHEIGRVDLATGKIFHISQKDSDYLGKVEESGKCYWHKKLAPDVYMGKVEELISFAHGGAAFLLLIFPLIEESRTEKESKENPADDLGTAPEQA